MSISLPKVIIILGPTASGKTDLGLQLAHEFKGEIISADSRQVYRGLNIATAKPQGQWETHDGERQFMVEGISHYLVDTYDPRHVFSAAEFKAGALAAIQKITARGNLPVVVGGTGLYIWSLVDNLSFAATPPSAIVRQEKSALNLEELVAELQVANPQLAGTTDLKNRRRVERALEITRTGGNKTRGPALVDPLMIGIRLLPAQLRAHIRSRIEEQFQKGLVEEARGLMTSGPPFNLPSLSGIGYPEVAAYLNGYATLEETKQQIETNTRRYAKRQVTWFKRDKRIVWLEGSDVERAEKLVAEFLG